jgi:two-component system NtrC family sensor kinase
MSPLSMLAASLSHGINNPMAYVSANLLFAIEELREIALDEEGRPSGEAAKRLNQVVSALTQAEDGARRVTGIVRRLEALGDAACQRNEPVDVRILLGSIVGLVECELGQDARVTAQLGEVPPVAGPRAEIASGLLQLMANAIQAVRDGDCEPSDIRLRTWTDEDGSAAIEVFAVSACSPPAPGGRAGEPGREERLGFGRREARATPGTSCEAAFQLKLAPFTAPAEGGSLRLA